MRLLCPNYYAWDGLTAGEFTIENIAQLSAKALLVSSTGARRPIREIASLIEERCPNWSVATVAEGGRMAMPTHPQVVNPQATTFLCGGS
jgi:hypothetical protein